MRFKYCPHCGSQLILKEIGDEGFIPYCTNCKIPLFDVFPCAIIVLIINEYNEALLLKQDYISSQYANLVSGYMKIGETAESCTYREVKEEVGLDLESLQYVSTYWFKKKEMLMIGFIGNVKKKEIKLSKEVNDAYWMNIHEAIHQVHPKGITSYALIEYYIKENEQSL